MAAGRAGCRYGSFLLTAWPPFVVEVALLLDLWVAITTITTPTANSTTTTVLMIIPQGVCFWLTIDLPFLAGGRPPGRPGGGASTLPAGRPGAGLPDPPGREPGLFGAEGDLRWAMVLPSGYAGMIGDGRVGGPV